MHVNCKQSTVLPKRTNTGAKLGIILYKNNIPQGVTMIYNPFVKCYQATSLADLATHKEEIQFVMYTSLNRIAQSFNDLNLTKYTCILKNILFESIRNKTKDVLQKLSK